MSTATAPFVHLRVHTEYSVADGLIKIPDLARRAAEMDMPAVAMTDRSNLFGLVKFYQACIQQGVKPIVGVDLAVADDSGEFRCLVLAADNQGYRHLLELVSRAYTEIGHRGWVERQWIAERADGLILLSGGVQGDLGTALLNGDVERARELAIEWRDVFGDRYYIEVMRTGRDGEDAYLAAALELAAELDIPVVATNDVCFLAPDDFEAHETRVCIHDSRTLDDPRRPRRYSSQQHLADSDAMQARFEGLEGALQNTYEIARRCNVTIDLDTYFLPDYPVPDGWSLEDLLGKVAREGLERRLEAIARRAETDVAQIEAPYRERLATELDIIAGMGFAGYFLIVMEFIGWAKDQSIPVGPGRGSGAGSLVAYSLDITDVDPLRYGLLFERFLNPERVSMPDFDVDFCMDGRDKVIAHVAEQYGEEAVSQIITFGTMAAKAVVRDVARVQSKPYNLADRVSKLIPFEVGMTLSKAVAEVTELRDLIAADEDVAEIVEMGYKLEGVVRNVGRHAGGVVIAPSRLTDFVPLFAEEAGGGLVSQFDMIDVERAGLVKFDFLGLKTLTIIDWAVAAINAGSSAESSADSSADGTLVLDDIPLDDPATYTTLKAAETTAVFQLESRGMKDLMRRLGPDRIEDIIALVALFRPGPLQSGAVEDYIDRKHGKSPVSYPHACLEPVLKDTYGVMLYQEHVMQIAQELAGFSLGEADLLRRAMGKKKPEEMAKMRQQFTDGVVANDAPEGLANGIFDDMEKFAGYAFNKSHSTAYAMVSYQTAWLKTHHPAHFMAAVLSADMQNTDKIVMLIDEIAQMKLVLDPPDINRSEYRFSGHGGCIVYGLGAIKGVGEGPIQALIEAREQTPFTSLAQFCQCVDSRKANRRVIEALIRAGAMDGFGGESEAPADTRAQLLACLAEAIHGAEQVARDAASGMTDLFGGVVAEERQAPSAVVVPLTRKELLQGEKDSLGGYFFSGHPIDDYLDEIRLFCPTRIADARVGRANQLIAGLVVSSRIIRGQRGERAFVEIDDRSGRVELVLFSSVLEEHRKKIQKDAVIVVEGKLQTKRNDDYQGMLEMPVEKVYTIDEARQRFAASLQIDLVDLPAHRNPGESDEGSERSPDESNAASPNGRGVRDANGAGSDVAVRLRRILQPVAVGAGAASGVASGVEGPPAGCRVTLGYQRGDARGLVRLGPRWRVVPSDDLLDRLRGEFGAEQVRLNYPGHAM